MQILIDRRYAADSAVDALIIPVFLGEEVARFEARNLIDQGEVTGKAFELTLVHNPTGLKAKRVLLAGAGHQQHFKPADFSRLVGAAVRFLKGKGVKSVGCEFGSWAEGIHWSSAAVEGAILGAFESDKYKTSDKVRLESFTLVAPDANADTELGAKRGQILANAQNLVREMVNQPSNLMTPATMADMAGDIARQYGLRIDVLDRDQMLGLRMGAVLGVSQGSAEPPKFIVLAYSPGSKHSSTHLGLVGKGVTFDAGGISIKPAFGMQRMKNDMAGGGAVLGAMQAIAELKADICVTGFIPCVENMPSGSAQRPGDIVTTMLGKTVEVINTDAEGRLILADALYFARTQGCTHLVDVATLTDAIGVALGNHRIGLFASDDKLRDLVLKASEVEGERMWHMPLDDEYKDSLSSSFADLANSGGRLGGAITAACFLKQFVTDTPWVHLDIAGTAWLDEAKPYMCRGATGLPVKTLVRLATDWQE